MYGVPTVDAHKINDINNEVGDIIDCFVIKSKEHNDLPSTSIDNLLPGYDLSTITKQVITYNDGSFGHAKYLPSHIQPLGCI